LHIGAEVPVSQEAHASKGGGGSELDPAAADVRCRGSPCRREETRLFQRMDCANHRLPSSSTTSSSSSDAAFRKTVARVGPPNPWGGVAPRANVATAPRPARPDAAVGSSAV